MLAHYYFYKWWELNTTGFGVTVLYPDDTRIQKIKEYWDDVFCTCGALMEAIRTEQGVKRFRLESGKNLFETQYRCTKQTAWDNHGHEEKIIREESKWAT